MIFRHDTSRNLDPALHTHSVIANMVRGADGKWRTMSNERLYASKMVLGAMYRNELARNISELGYRVEKTHADGRLEIAGVPRRVIEAYSTRRAEIEAAVAERGGNATAGNQRLAQRAALMTRSAKLDVDRDALRESWQRQASELGFDPRAVVEAAVSREASQEANAGNGVGGVGAERAAEGSAVREPAAEAVDWAVAHLSEREAVFARTGLLAAALARNPGAAGSGEIERGIAAREKAGTLHAVSLPGACDSLTTARAVARERETIALMEAGQGRAGPPMRARAVDKALRNGPLTRGQREAVKLILSANDRVVGVQGYAGTGKTTMLNRARALLGKKGYAVRGLAPSASAARTLEAEAGVASETLQRFLARYQGVARGRMTRKGEKAMRAAYQRTVLVVDEGSFASTLQARDLLRIANTLRVPRVVLVGDEKQLDAVDAGKPFAQLQRAGMRTAVMDEIMRQRDPELKAAVEASLAGDVKRAFEKLGTNVVEVRPDGLAGAAAARWLALPPERRARTALLAPSHALRERINGIVRERLVRDGIVRGPALKGERLVSRGYTNAQKTLAANYAPGDVVAFHRPYRRLGVEKGDELRVAEVDHKTRAVTLEGPDGRSVVWEPNRLAARSGGVEVYRVEDMELRAGDRIRWTRNDADLGLVNSQTAEVAAVSRGTVRFRLEDGRAIDLRPGDPQMRHMDRAWASTVHAFQGRTVDAVIAVMEANHPNLTTQKTFYVEISRARDRAELVTDDRSRLRERLETATGERIAAFEAVGPERTPGRDGGLDADKAPGIRGPESGPGRRALVPAEEREPGRGPKNIEHDMAL